MTAKHVQPHHGVGNDVKAALGGLHGDAKVQTGEDKHEKAFASAWMQRARAEGRARARKPTAGRAKLECSPASTSLTRVYDPSPSIVLDLMDDFSAKLLESAAEAEAIVRTGGRWSGPESRRRPACLWMTWQGKKLCSPRTLWLAAACSLCARRAWLRRLPARPRPCHTPRTRDLGAARAATLASTALNLCRPANSGMTCVPTRLARAQ